jgi:hypothetical protein
MPQSSDCFSCWRSHIFCDAPHILFPFPFFSMEAKKKNPPPAGDAQAAKRAPIKVFTADDVSAAVFAHSHQVRGEMRTYYSITFTRWYRDRGGKNRYVNSFGLEDLGKVITVAQQADQYLRELPQPETA